jgi:hypothetical protein
VLLLSDGESASEPSKLVEASRLAPPSLMSNPLLAVELSEQAESDRHVIVQPQRIIDETQ